MISRQTDTTTEPERGQSEVIGVVLLLAITITSIGIISVVGFPSLSQATETLSDARIENEFALLDARIASTALGGSSSQKLKMNVRRGTLTSYPNGSYINITQRYNSSSPYDNRTLANISMGYIEHELSNGEKVAFEGGGVWRKGSGSNQTVVLSPPEFYYEGQTLTLPVFNILTSTSVTGEGSNIQVSSGEDPKTLYPDPDYVPGPNEEDKTNPLSNGSIYITVKSEYYQGWVKYFESRTDTQVTSVDPSENEAEIRLTVPIAPQELNSAGVYEGSCSFNGAYNCGSGSTFESLEKGSLPNVDSFIRNKIETAQNGNPGTVETWNNGMSCSGDCSEPLYYADLTTGDLIINNVDFDVSSNNVTVAIDNRGGSALDIDQLDVIGASPSSPNRLRILTTGDVDFPGNNGPANGGSTSGNSSKMVIYVESGSDVQFQGSMNGVSYGVIYAPGSELTISGGPGGSWNGTVAAGSVTNNGNPGTFNEGSGLELNPGDVGDPITFLHVTENNITVR